MKSMGLGNIDRKFISVSNKIYRYELSPNLYDYRTDSLAGAGFDDKDDTWSQAYEAWTIQYKEAQESINRRIADKDWAVLDAQ